MNSKVPSRLPLYRQVYDQLALRISQGDWLEGDMLPSEWDLAAELQVSQGTVRKALGELVNDGFLYRQQGRGTFVAASCDDWAGMSLVTPGLFGESPDRLQREFLGVSRIGAADEVCEAFGLRRGSVFHRVRLLWRLRGRAVALDDVLLPLTLLPELDGKQLRQAGVWSLLQQEGLRLHVVSQQWRAIRSGRDERQLLGIDAELPLLLHVRLAADATGKLVEWRDRLCVTDQQALTQREV